MDVFVFGSNLAGRHGKGAALDAVRYHGAKYGVGVGLQGKSYAIPTKNRYLQPLSLEAIALHIKAFILVAESMPEHTFYVTPVGCGLAGYKREQIKPLFDGMPQNCRFAETW